MTAQALVIKAKNVLVEEAIDLLYKEIESKRMAINGSFVPMEIEKSGEMEQGLFLIRHLMEEKPAILRAMTVQINQLESSKRLTSEDIQRIESARKFMLTVEHITTLLEYGTVFEQWFDDVSMRIKDTDPSIILAKTANGNNTHRTSSLRFLVNSKMFRGGTFTNEEKNILKNALQLAVENIV